MNRITESSNPCCLIVGAAGGIGSAIARLLAREGYRLHLADRDKKRLEIVAVECNASSTVCDLTDEMEILSLFDRTDQGVNVVINAAGQGYFGDIQSIDADTFRKSFAINFFSPLECRPVIIAVLI